MRTGNCQCKAAKCSTAEAVCQAKDAASAQQKSAAYFQQTYAAYAQQKSAAYFQQTYEVATVNAKQQMQHNTKHTPRTLKIMGCGINYVSIRICGFANKLASDARYEVATSNTQQHNAAQYKQSAKHKTSTMLRNSGLRRVSQTDQVVS